ncbi:hypothetical protein CHS0354_032923, partial [Potamilus streckersoni]
ETQPHTLAEYNQPIKKKNQNSKNINKTITTKEGKTHIGDNKNKQKEDEQLVREKQHQKQTKQQKKKEKVHRGRPKQEKQRNNLWQNEKIQNGNSQKARSITLLTK